MPRKGTPRTGAFDVLIRGDGIAALLSAIDCARIGLRTVVVSSDSDEIADTRTFASAWGGVMAGVCSELNVSFREESPLPGEECILGIPGSPLSRVARASLGSAGALRAYVDRLSPLLTIGEEFNLAKLVVARLGRRALDELVRPAVLAELGADPEDVDVRDVAPGLVQAMSRVGSLTLGVLEVAAADPTTVTRVHPHDGMIGLRRAAEIQADYFAVTRLTNSAEIPPAHSQLDFTEPVYSMALHVGIARARHEAARSRNGILSDPEYSPIGPIDLER